MDLIIISFLLLFFGAASCLFSKKKAGYISLFVIAISLLSLVLQGSSGFREYRWVEPLGVTFGILLDNLSFPISLIILLISLIASFFSMDYMKGKKNVHIYFANLILFTAGMYGAILGTNFIQFYVFWELMIIPAYFLIAYWGHGQATKIALKFFIFMHAGALMILFGLLWMYSYTNSFSFVEIAQLHSLIPLNVVRWVSLLFLIGFGVKMAIFPLHGWLPDAHSEAPAPVSAMFSGLMIKVGAYGIGRIVLPFFGFYLINNNFWMIVVGLVTMLYGGMMALAQTDIKRLFAYSSISQIGYVFFGLSLMNPTSYTGAIFFIINHAIVKALLFFISGVLIYSVGTRDIRKMGGLLKDMPLTGFACLVAVLALAGTPLLNIFVSEWIIFQGGIQSGNILATGMAIGITLLTAAYALWMIKRVFFGNKPTILKVRPPTLKMKITMIILALLIIVIGTWPTPWIQMLV